MALISVIVPVYNVEKYLGECLDSLCNQTFQDIEIICVNDGSTDSSLDILESYASKDSRIKILTQQNQGPSAARNNGLRNAYGKYIYFMDSDDILELDALEKLHDIAEKEDIDCVLFKLNNFYDETKEEFATDYYDMPYLKGIVDGKVFSHRDIPDDVYHLPVSPPGKLFKKDLIEDIEFVEGVIFEDNVFFIEALFKAKRLYFLDEYLYNRRIRKNSLMTSNKNFTDYIKVSNMIIDVTKKYGLYEDYKLQLLDKTLTNTYLRFTQVSDDVKDDFFKKMKEDFLAKKEEYDSCHEFQQQDTRFKEIFYKVLECDTYKEYHLSIQLFDTQAKLDDTIEAKKQMSRQKAMLFRRTRDLSNQINTLASENRKLKQK